jgi:hypothetical protein
MWLPCACFGAISPASGMQSTLSPQYRTRRRILMSESAHTGGFPGFDLFRIQTMLAAMFTAFHRGHWGGFQNCAGFLFATPLVRMGLIRWQNGTSSYGGFTPIVQGCSTDAFLAGQLGNGQAVRGSHLLENGFFKVPVSNDAWLSSGILRRKLPRHTGKLN